MRKAFLHKKFTIRLSVELATRIEKMAELHNVTPVDLIRQYLDSGVLNEETALAFVKKGKSNVNNTSKRQYTKSLSASGKS